MEGKIQKEKGKRDIALIKELDLSECKSSSVVGLSEDWKSLENLTLINVGLTTLKGFPKLPNLKKLNLCGNKLTGGLDALASLPNLQVLILSSNKIKDLETLLPLKEIKTLNRLNLLSCDLCKIENYRTKLFELLPSVKLIDGLNRGEKEKVGKEKNGAKGEVPNSEDDDSLDEEDEEEEEEDLDEEEEDEEDTSATPLETLYKKLSDLDDEDDDDFEGDEDEEDDEDIDEEDEDGTCNISKRVEEIEATRGKKRTHEDDD